MGKSARIKRHKANIQKLKEQQEMTPPQPELTDDEKLAMQQAMGVLKQLHDKYNVKPPQASSGGYNPIAFEEHPQGEDLNRLPLPNTQDVQHNKIKWTWWVSDDLSVEGNLYTRGNSKGQYDVFIYQTGESFRGDRPLIDIGDVAKKLGQALIAASDYKNVWKDHAGMFMEREFEKPVFEAEKPSAQVIVPDGIESKEGVMTDPVFELMQPVDEPPIPDAVPFGKDVHEALPDE